MSKGKDSAKFPAELVYHDFFNLVVLGIVCVMNSYYLYVATKWELIGTADIGSDPLSRQVYDISGTIFLIYLFIDMTWIFLVPKSIIVKPYEVIIHHIATICLVLVPFFNKEFQWHGAISISVEIQTLVQITRRRFEKSSLGYKISEILFYFTWFIFRIILFPVLTVFFWYEYKRNAIRTNDPLNPVILGTPLFTLLTLQGWYWTYKVLTKSLNVGAKDA